MKKEKNYKSCPRCAKKNDINAKKCSKCNYDFKKKGVSLWLNILISLTFVIVLIVLKYLKLDIVDNVKNVFKILSIGILICLLISTLTYGKTELVTYPGEEEIKFKRKFLNLRIISLIAMITALILAIIGVYYYLTHVK